MVWCAYSSKSAHVACSELFNCLNQFTGHCLAITVEHAGVVAEEQGVFDTGEALALAALDDNDIA